MPRPYRDRDKNATGAPLVPIPSPVRDGIEWALHQAFASVEALTQEFQALLKRLR